MFLVAGGGSAGRELVVPGRTGGASEDESFEILGKLPTLFLNDAVNTVANDACAATCGAKEMLSSPPSEGVPAVLSPLLRKRCAR